jgi:hypothetical protein
MQNIKPMKRSLLCLLFLLLICGGQVRAVDVSTPAAGLSNKFSVKVGLGDVFGCSG